MIGQCLSNKNESATVPKTKKFSELNKALGKKVEIYLTIHLKYLNLHDTPGVALHYLGLPPKQQLKTLFPFAINLGKSSFFTPLYRVMQLCTSVICLQLLLQFLSPNIWIISKDTHSLTSYPLLIQSFSCPPHGRHTCTVIDQNCYMQNRKSLGFIEKYN